MQLPIFKQMLVRAVTTQKCQQSQPATGVCHDRQDDHKVSLESHATTRAFPKLVVWSSQEQGGLKRISESWKEYLGEKSRTLNPEEDSKIMSNLAYNAAKRRTRFPWRSFTVSSGANTMANGNSDIAPAVRSSQRPSLALVFTGQGAQHYAMSRRLMEYEVYANSIKSADKFLKFLGCQWSLVEELSRDAKSSRINPPEFSHPICIALQVAMVELLRSLGIWPSDPVIGHSGAFWRRNSGRIC